MDKLTARQRLITSMLLMPFKYPITPRTIVNLTATRKARAIDPQSALASPEEEPGTHGGPPLPLGQSRGAGDLPPEGGPVQLDLLVNYPSGTPDGDLELGLLRRRRRPVAARRQGPARPPGHVQAADVAGDGGGGERPAASPPRSRDQTGNGEGEKRGHG